MSSSDKGASNQAEADDDGKALLAKLTDTAYSRSGQGIHPAKNCESRACPMKSIGPTKEQCEQCKCALCPFCGESCDYCENFVCADCLHGFTFAETICKKCKQAGRRKSWLPSN